MKYQQVIAHRKSRLLSPVRRRFRIRKLYIFGFIMLVAAIFAIAYDPGGTHFTFANNNNDDLRQQLQNNVDDGIGNINLDDLDKMVSELENSSIFGGGSFVSRVGRILSGEFNEDYPNLFVAIMALFGGVVLGIMPMMMLIVGVSVLSGFIQSLKSGSDGEGVRDVIHFVTYAAVVILVMVNVVDMVSMVGGTLGSMRRQMDIIFPILLTLMVSIGGNASASVYQPAVAVLSNGVMQIFSTVVMPIFIITLVFSVVGGISQNTRLDKFVGFFTSAYKWIIGLVFTIFLAFLTIQGITAATHDGISVRAARLTISSYVPYLGGYISQGFDLVMASSILIKNAIGVAGLYLMFAVVLGPIVQIVVFGLGLKLAAAITQPIADKRISDFLTSINKCFSMLVSVLIGAAFMYFLTIGLIIMTGNSIL